MNSMVRKRLLQLFARDVRLMSKNYSSAKNVHIRRVIVSRSLDIYENLALETWLYENTDLEKESILLLWRNRPAIVFGRHQNPWLECNLPAAQKLDVDLARRNSGGGTVYHDEGNLNLSFLKNRDLYNRHENLELVVDAMMSQWNLDLSINEREDIILDKRYKISGTASKLARRRTYHHFTLLHNVDKDRLKSILYTNIPEESVTCNATKSTRMSVANLADHNHNIDYDNLVHTVSERFIHGSQCKDTEFIDKIDDVTFPGVGQICNGLKSWEWKFGKTPPFSLKRNFNTNLSGLEFSLDVNISVTKGTITDIGLKYSESKIMDNSVFLKLQASLEGVRLDKNDVINCLTQIKTDCITNGLYTLETGKEMDWFLLCILKTLGLTSD